MRECPRQLPTVVPARFCAQRGFLLVAAVAFIVVAALLVGVMVFFTATGSHSSARNLSAKQALYIAGTGLERGTRALLSPQLAEPLACGAISGNTNLTNMAFGAGRFTVTAGNGGAPYYSAAATTLKAGINATDNTIPVNSPSGYARAGRVLIDREAIDYSDTEAVNDTLCGGAGRAPCLVGAQRGQDGTVAASHAAGTPVGQYQCDLQSQGGVPDFVSVRGMRTLQQGVQLQEGWIVGDRINGSISGWRFLRWNGTANPDVWAAQAVTTPGTPAQRLRAVSMLNYADGWAVGDRAGGGFNQWTFLRWNAAAGAWNAVAVNTPGTGAQNLNGVYMLSATDGWAVGNLSGARPVALRWNTPCGGGAGTGTWNDCTSNAYVPAINQALNSVYMASATDGWAAGPRRANSTSGWNLLHWNGAAWSVPPLVEITTPGTRPTTLNAVFMLSSTDGWAVGNTGGGGGGCSNNARILRWNGTVWNCVQSPSGQNLNAIYMTSSTDGWAVGNRFGGGTNGWNLVRWDGSAWGNFPVNTPGAGAQNLNAVACATANDCWAAGNNGAVLHWDGTSWTSIAVAGVTQALRSVSVISHQEIARSAWREVFQ
jgi:hypothetical protein